MRSGQPWRSCASCLHQAQTGRGPSRHRPPGARGTRGTVIVLDASAALDWLLQTSAGQRIEKRIYSHHESLHAPHLLDLEVAQVLRRLVREGAVSPIARIRRSRISWTCGLLATPTSCCCPGFGNSVIICRPIDAAYVVLAEKLGARLLTRDGRLASASGHAALIELF